MKYFLVVSPNLLESNLLEESKRIMKEVYGRKVNNCFFRVKTKQELDNPRRLFIKGDGRVIETEIKPHISLIHNIELEDSEIMASELAAICDQHSPIDLEFDGIGNYGMDFTFFVKYKDSPNLGKLRDDLLSATKGYMTEEEYNQHIDAEYIPHATILYDDIDPEKVLEAFDMLDRTKFTSDLQVNEILLWQVTPFEQKTVASYPLSKPVIV